MAAAGWETWPGGMQASKSPCHNPELLKAGTEQGQFNSEEETDSRDLRGRNNGSQHQFNAEEDGGGGISGGSHASPGESGRQ